MRIAQGRKTRRTIWESEQAAHPIRGEHGIILPVEFAIPAETAKELEKNYSWSVTARTNGLPLFYRATFIIPIPPASSVPQPGS